MSDPSSLLASRVEFERILRSPSFAEATAGGEGRENLAPAPAIFLVFTKHDAPATCARAEVENAFAWVEGGGGDRGGGGDGFAFADGGGRVTLFVTSAYSGQGVQELAERLQLACD
mmetsp:Transcript_5844/g.15124  ORF Transcript_5844/g.15124 Transcript_5844/m.15124 type:complete len:116 (-) Transcript_5844:16-363(-)